MANRDAIHHALETAGITEAVAGRRDLSGGCIHQVTEITLASGRRLVAKQNRAANLGLFEEEAHSLRALAATHTVPTPQPLAVVSHGNQAVLLMTAIDATSHATSAAWKRFGEELAMLHRADVGGRYGFDRDNHIGTTLQPNLWHDDWVEFNRTNRLGFQAELAASNGLLEAAEMRAVQAVIERLDEFIPRRPKPSLLHGDLWSGNALPAGENRVAVIDPACSVGDGWADIAMMRLFGGFPNVCLDAYAANVPDHEHIERRIAAYQLYHVLNHVNIFGRSYAGQSAALARRLIE